MNFLLEEKFSTWLTQGNTFVFVMSYALLKMQAVYFVCTATLMVFKTCYPRRQFNLHVSLNRHRLVVKPAQNQ
jgi:hypothetical protein